MKRGVYLNRLQVLRFFLISLLLLGASDIKVVRPQKVLAVISDCGGHLDCFSPHPGASTLGSSRSSRSASPRHGDPLPYLSEDLLKVELGEAHEAYLEGVAAMTIAARRDKLNQAVSLYEEVAKSYGSAQLYYNLASCYAQLEEWPWAVYYYAEAQRFAPRDRGITQQLNRARERLSLPKVAWQVPLSPSETTIMFISSVLLFLLIGSLAIWRRSRATLAPTVLSFFLVLGVSLFYFNQPLKGVLVECVSMEGGMVPAGTFATIKRGEGDLVEVVLEGGKRGELSGSSIRTLFP
jgi:tetratricopeptide (TPR) repeat protein